MNSQGWQYCMRKPKWLPRLLPLWHGLGCTKSNIVNGVLMSQKVGRSRTELFLPPRHHLLLLLLAGCVAACLPMLMQPLGALLAACKPFHPR